MTNRTTLLDSADFRLYARLSPVSSPPGGHALTISSQRLHSRNPYEEHVRFLACLDRQGLQALADLLQATLSAPANPQPTQKGPPC
jgi:hypothetical protein